MVTHYLKSVFLDLDERSDVSDSEIVNQELVFLPLLEDGKRKLKLHKVMAEDPQLFNQVIGMVFRPKGEPEKSKMDEGSRSRWRLAYSALSKFKQLPGRVEDDIHDKELTNWVDQVRVLGKQTGHSEITDIYIGHLFSHAPLDADGGWPHSVIRDQIERLASEELERGIMTERFNMRGVTSKSMYEGGKQERELAQQYLDWKSTAANWLRTSALLGAIADNWERDAKSNDTEAAQRKLKS